MRLPLEGTLLEKLRKIEALHAGTKVEGEREAARRAAERIRARLGELRDREPEVEYRYSLPDPWKRKLFLALSRRYGLKPYREHGHRYTSVMLRAPKSFQDKTLWPEYQALSKELDAHLEELTTRVIREPRAEHLEQRERPEQAAEHGAERVHAIKQADEPPLRRDSCEKGRYHGSQPGFLTGRPPAPFPSPTRMTRFRNRPDTSSTRSELPAAHSMTNSLATATSAIAILFSFYGCKASEPNPPVDAEGGDSGKASAGKDGGGAQAANGGKGGTSGSSSDAGGEAGMATGAIGGSGNAAGRAGSVGVGGQAGVEHRDYILGPEEDDQAPITVPSSYSGIIATEPLLYTDDQGDVFTMGRAPIPGSSNNEQDVLYKYDRSFKAVWSYELLSGDDRLGIGPMSAAPNGEVFFGGITQTSLSGETYYSGSYDAIAGKLTSDGTIEWVHEFGAKGADEAKLTAVTPDGAVIVAGQSTGLLAGMPASAASGVWLARYEADGTQTFLQQYEEFGDGTSIRDYTNLFIDAAGRAVMVGNNQVFQADALTGKEIGRFLRDTVRDSFPNDQYSLPVTIDAAGKALYSWNETLAKFDLDENLLWYREFEPQRKVLIDATKNLYWFGDLIPTAGQHMIAVASDAVYLAGHYDNSYATTTGGTVPAANVTMYVGRYDLDGNRVWFQELVVDSDAALVPTDFLGVVLDPKENPIVAVSSANRADGGFLFKLDKADGSLL